MCECSEITFHEKAKYRAATNSRPTYFFFFFFSNPTMPGLQTYLSRVYHLSRAYNPVSYGGYVVVSASL